ncbi:MAG: glycosyltransferase [Leptolyngbya sp. Prado105]|jgi:glycosyltransferase involved in cell wall biosynthesis|nr:glycosyltransferase [Leptolyngbya sp. Prado105]
MQPKVSIAINNYNYDRYLAQAIESALNQSDTNVEVIVVDDGSTDQSRQVIEQFSDRVIPVYKSNGGQASAFNAGFAASSGDIICFLDADDMFLPHKVKEVGAAIGDPTVPQWCFHPLQVANAEMQPIEPMFQVGELHRLDLRQDVKKGRLKGKLPFAIPATSGLCFTRSLLDKILPMPEAEAILLNDSFLQFAALGIAPGVALDQPLALQRLHSSNAYTQNSQAHQMNAPIRILTASALRDRFPVMKRFANCLYAEGMGLYWKRVGIETRIQPWVDRYQAELSPVEACEIWMRATYHLLKP